MKCGTEETDSGIIVVCESLDQFLTDFNVQIEAWEFDAPPLSRWSGAKFSALPKKNKAKASQKSRDLQGYLAESARLQLRVMASINMTGRAYRVAEQKTQEMNESTLTTNEQNKDKERQNVSAAVGEQSHIYEYIR